MKKRRLFCLTVIAGAIVAAISISCAFPSQVVVEGASVTDISAGLDFMTVSRQGFMGGSILYNPKAPSTGQLAKGVSVAVRLGYVSREEVGEGQVVFSNIQEKSQYGSLVVTEISEQAIGFTVKFYDADGNLITNDAPFTLSAGSEVDINGDGLPDLEYRKFAQKRDGFEGALELVFINSQEALHTSMFAVLQEQYARSVYPSGIIGINPNGRFIYSKYEGNSAARSVVSGLQRGDYVMDGKEGKYQRVTANAAGRGARAVSDAEVEDIAESSDEKAFLFKSADFDNGYSADSLLAALPDSVKSGLASGETSLNKLNMLIQNRYLAKEIALAQGNFVTDAEYEDSIAGLQNAEIIRMNRTMLAELYVEVCPPFFNPDGGFIEAVPLASLVIGNDGVVSTEPVDNISRAASLSTYVDEKNAINRKFSSYKQVFSYTFNTLPNVPAVTYNSYPTVKVGVKGIFHNTWGSISGGLEAVVYFTTEVKANFSTSASYSRNLLPPTECRRSITAFAYGPIVINVSANFGIKLPLTASLSTDSNLNIYYTGMYGGHGEVGVDYGVRWKKWWFIKYPEVYINPWQYNYQIKETAYYLSGDTSNTASITLTPTVYGGVGMNVTWVVGAELNAQAALQGKLQAALSGYVSYDGGMKWRANLTGTATVKFIPSVYLQPWVGIDVPFYGFWGKRWNVTLYNTETTLRSWTLVSKTVGN